MQKLLKFFGNRVKRKYVTSISSIGMQAIELLRDNLMDRYQTAIVFTQIDVAVIPKKEEEIKRESKISREVLIEAFFYHTGLERLVGGVPQMAPRVIAQIIFESPANKIHTWKATVLSVRLENTKASDCSNGWIITETGEYLRNDVITDVFNKYAPVTITVPRK